jgi:hypothetical protein
LDIVACPRLHTLRVLLAVTRDFPDIPPISWLTSELATDPPVPITNVKRITIFFAIEKHLAFIDNVNDHEFWHQVKDLSEALANQERFPGLKSVAIIAGFYDLALLREDVTRQESRARPYTEKAEQRRAFGEATQAIARRGLDDFEIKWELHDTNPWYWYQGL